MLTKSPLTSWSFLIYSYLTTFLVVVAPLFFVPFTGFLPMLTNYFLLYFGTTIALIAYIIYAFRTKHWKAISRTEWGLYALYIFGLLLHVVVTTHKEVSFFGNDIATFSVGSLLLLPAVTLLVRSLPHAARELAKRGLLLVISLLATLFLITFLVQNSVTSAVALIFQSHNSLSSLAFFVSLVSIVSLFVITHTSIRKRYKLFLALLGIGVMICAYLVFKQGDVRPSVSASLMVARSTFLEHGPFGIGATEYMRAWQLYRPQAIVESPYFDMDFLQGAGTLLTALTTLGLIGALILIIVVVHPIIRSFREAKIEKEPRDRFINFTLSALLLYFFVLSWMTPFSYAALFVWFALIGFVYGREKREYQKTWTTMSLFVILLIPICMYSFVLAQKTRAFAYFESGKQLAQSGGDAQQVLDKIEKAILIHPMDGFYRAKSDIFADQAVKVVNVEGLSEQEITQVYGGFASQSVDASLKAVEFGKDTYQNYVNLGRAYELVLPLAGAATAENPAYKNAKMAYEKAITLYPSNPYLRLLLARLEASVGQKDNAKKTLKEAIATKKNFGDALYLMSQLSASEKNTDDAILYAVEAVKASPNDAKAYIQAGLLFYGNKEYQNAVIALQKALELDPTSGTVAYFLALTFRDAGQKDVALSIAKELYAQNRNSTEVRDLLKTLETTSEDKKTTKK